MSPAVHQQVSTLPEDAPLPLAEWLANLREGSLARAELAKQELASASELLSQCMDWAQSAAIPFRGRMAKVISQLPRDLHWRWDDARRAAIRSAPALVGNRWDALLTAMVEHVADSHGDACPDWAHHPRRFLAKPWFVSPHWGIVSDHWLGAPAAFIRHNAFPDPAELNERGGEREQWVSGACRPRGRPFPCKDRDLQCLAEKLAGAGLVAKVLLVHGRSFPMIYRHSPENEVPCLDRSRLAAEAGLQGLVAATARERRLPDEWLQRYAQQRPPRPGTPLPVFCSKPSLCVTGCKPSLPLFMMLLSRRDGDAVGIRFLLHACGVRSENEALRQARRMIPAVNEMLL